MVDSLELLPVIVWLCIFAGSTCQLRLELVIGLSWQQMLACLFDWLCSHSKVGQVSWIFVVCSSAVMADSSGVEAVKCWLVH